MSCFPPERVEFCIVTLYNPSSSDLAVMEKVDILKIELFIKIFECVRSIVSLSCLFGLLKPPIVQF